MTVLQFALVVVLGVASGIDITDDEGIKKALECIAPDPGTFDRNLETGEIVAFFRGKAKPVRTNAELLDSICAAKAAAEEATEAAKNSGPGVATVIALVGSAISGVLFLALGIRELKKRMVWSERCVGFRRRPRTGTVGFSSSTENIWRSKQDDDEDKNTSGDAGNTSGNATNTSGAGTSGASTERGGGTGGNKQSGGVS